MSKRVNVFGFGSSFAYLLITEQLVKLILNSPHF